MKVEATIHRFITLFRHVCPAVLLAAASLPAHAREFHVSTAGDAAAKPLRSIQAAAGRAQPGDVITVREGVYRERVDPPRGGESDAKRIVYQAAPGSKAVIKIHAAIDSLIAHNHVHHTNRGIWLDWMAQGARVTRNLLHDNSTNEDLFVEVNHGPCLVDHNIFLSPQGLVDWSEGGAYAHNLFAGKVLARPELSRQTPWQEEHGTKIAGLMSIKGGDNRFFNNVFIAPAGLDTYDESSRANQMAGNVFLKGAKPSRHEKPPDRWSLPNFPARPRSAARLM